MDLGFIRRNRPVAIDLSALLARTSAAQSASPTARAQVLLDSATGRFQPVDPHIAVFADDSSAWVYAGCAASFADLSGDFFSPRQPS
jgi:hypothetical protein